MDAGEALCLVFGLFIFGIAVMGYCVYESNCAYNNGYNDGFSEHNNITYHYAMNYAKVHEDGSQRIDGNYYIGYCDGYIDRETNHRSN